MIGREDKRKKFGYQKHIKPFRTLPTVSPLACSTKLQPPAFGVTPPWKFALNFPKLYVAQIVVVSVQILGSVGAANAPWIARTSTVDRPPFLIPLKDNNICVEV
jgi:hypothetical protein